MDHPHDLNPAADYHWLSHKNLDCHVQSVRSSDITFLFFCRYLRWRGQGMGWKDVHLQLPPALLATSMFVRSRFRLHSELRLCTSYPNGNIRRVKVSQKEYWTLEVRKVGAKVCSALQVLDNIFSGLWTSKDCLRVFSWWFCIFRFTVLAVVSVVALFSLCAFVLHAKRTRKSQESLQHRRATIQISLMEAINQVWSC